MSRLALRIAQSAQARALIERSPLTAPVVARFIAGTTEADALAVATSLTSDNCLVTLNHLGEYTTQAYQAAQAAQACQRVLRLLGANGLAPHADVSLKLSSLGRSLPVDGEKIALENARMVCTTAAETGATVTLDMEEYSSVDSTLGILSELREDFQWTGAVLQAQLRRTQADCAELAGPESRVRLCKGAYAAPPSVAFAARSEVDRSYARCLKTLFGGQGYPMVATHDPRMIAIADRLAEGKAAGNYEFQMLYGFRADEQKRLAAAGKAHESVRALRLGVVRVLHPKAGRAPGEPEILPERAPGAESRTSPSADTRDSMSFVAGLVRFPWDAGSRR